MTSLQIHFPFPLVGCEANLTRFSHYLHLFLWSLKGKRNVRLVMKLTSPELDQEEAPSNKIGQENNQFLKWFGHIFNSVT